MDNQVWPSGPTAFFQVGGVAAPPTWKKKEAGLRVYPKYWSGIHLALIVDGLGMKTSNRDTTVTVLEQTDLQFFC